VDTVAEHDFAEPQREESLMPGQLVHTEIPADDTSKSKEFWGSLFGWEFEAFPSGSEYHMARISDAGGVAITNMEPGKRGTRSYFDVDNIDDGIAKVKQLGGEADVKMPVPAMGWFATCRDPHGNEFGLWQNDADAPVPAG
jgi:predicted enzyme related to lactoylglutathione lyase